MASSVQTIAERKALSFLILRNAVEALELQVDPRAPLEDLCENFKDFHNLVLTAMTDLVDLVGGYSVCIPVPDFLSDDIDSAFIQAQRQEDASAPVYASYSTLNHAQQGIAR